MLHLQLLVRDTASVFLLNYQYIDNVQCSVPLSQFGETSGHSLQYISFDAKVVVRDPLQAVVICIKGFLHPPDHKNRHANKVFQQIWALEICHYSTVFNNTVLNMLLLNLQVES